MQCIWSTVTYKIRGYIKKPHKQYPFQAEIPKSLDRLDAGGVSISNALFGLNERPMAAINKSRHDLFIEIEKPPEHVNENETLFSNI